MNPTKEILELIEKRRKYGSLANSYDGKVQQWCVKHNIYDDDIISDYGCMLTSEPDGYADMIIKRIKET